MTSGQETELVYSYNPGARTGPCSRTVITTTLGYCLTGLEVRLGNP